MRSNCRFREDLRGFGIWTSVKSMTTSATRTELQQASTAFEDFLARFFHEQAERYAYGDLFEPLFLDMSEFVGRRGKRIRPLLLMGSYRVFGGERSLEDIALLRAALSLELLHAFILVHDDVIDRSEKRRGLSTLHKLVEERLGRIDGAARTGENVALVVGDMLFALAVEDLALGRFSRRPSRCGARPVSALHHRHRRGRDLRYPARHARHRAGDGGGHRCACIRSRPRATPSRRRWCWAHCWLERVRKRWRNWRG